MGVNSWSTPSNSANTTKTSKGINSWSTPPRDVNPAKVLKGVTPLYTIKQQEQEAQEKEPTLLDKVYLSSAKQKQSTGVDLNVPEIGVTMKYNVEPVKNPKNISQAINYKAELDKKETEKFEKAIQKTDDFSISGKALTDLSGITDKKTYQNIINREGIYQYMTADERRIYKYLIAKKDNASARKYILDKMSDLESRKAYAVAGSNEGGFVGTVKDFSTAAKSGFESGLTNMARMGVAGNIAAGNSMGVLNKLLEPTYSEKLYEQVRANAKDKGYVYGVLLDATNSIAAQLPQIAMGAAGGSGAYLSAMALQIIGADTTEAINQGYDGMRGVVYGIFDTALEFATEKVLGGIASKLDGGETSRLVRAALNAVDSTVSNKKVANALAKTISVLSSANSEGVEEFLQAVIEPVMRNVIYGERNNLNAETFKEAVRAYIVGAVSGGIMDIPFANNTLENTRADITGKFLKENAGVESVLKLSEVVGNNSELYGEIKSSFDGGRDVSNTDLAMLYQQSAIMFEQPSEETYKNFAERNVDALIKEAVNKQSNENSPDSESAKYMAESANSQLQNGAESDIISSRGESYVRTDEFRRLQAESKGMSDEDIQLYHSGKREVDEELRKNISGILRSQIDAARNGVRNDYGILDLSAKGNQFNLYQNVDGELFHDVFEIARSYLRNGELVDLHGVNTTDEGIGYNDCFNYLSEDGLSGFSITPDGDLISVFNASGKPGFLNAIAPQVKEKVKTLDCYNSSNQPLMGIYSKVFGFKTASVMDYNMEYDHDNIAENHGNPQVAFMVNTDDEVETKHFTKEQYDEAKEYRDGFVKSEFGTKSVFTEYSAKKYKADPIESYIFKEHGREKLSDDQLKIIMVARKLGHSVIYEDTAKTRGFKSDGYIENDGTIHIDYDNTKPVQFIFKHELTHYAEGSEPYKNFVETVKASKTYKKWIAQKVNGKDSAAVKSAKYRQSVIDGYAASGIELTPMQAESELIADFVGDTLFTEDGSRLESIMSDMNAKQRKSFVQYIKDFFAYIKDKLSRNKTASSDILKLEKMFNETLSAVEQKNTADENGVKYSIGFSEENNASETKQILLLINNSIEKISDEQVFDVADDNSIENFSKKTDYVMEVFNEQGNIAHNSVIGDVELSKSGAKSTIMHGFGREKLAAIKAIKPVIENGEVISKFTNYNNTGVDRYIIAAKGVINGEKAIVGVVVKSYPSKAGNSKFYLHEAEIIKTGSPVMTAPQLSVDTVSKSVSDITVPQKAQSVNTSISENAKNGTKKFSIPFNQAELLDKYDRGEITREEYLNQSNENWKEAVNNYGTIEAGENPVNDIPVPKSVDGKQKTQRFSRTVIESGKLTNRMVEDMGADILLGKFAYTPVSDESAQKAADKAVKGGFAESSWQEAVNASKQITKDKIAIGEKLLMQAIANKDTKRVLELSAELSDVLTRNGQNIQAASMFKKMTGAGKLLTVQQYVNTLNKDLEAKYGENAPTVKINELIAQQIAESKPGEDIYSIYEDALQDVAAQVPATFLDKWNAWRYMAMLVNPTTHLRNIAGNGLFVPSVRMKDFISASLETAFIKDKNKRTKSIVIKKEYKEFAKKDLTSAEVKNALKSGGKFNIETKISEKQRIFKNNVLEFIRVGNGNLLEAEDLIFKNIHYKHALAGFLQARGANLNNIDESLLWEARAYAVQEAMKATFNDANSISTALSAAANKNKALNIAINGILPFKKTPINVVRRGVEYSPIGLLKTVVKGSYDLKQGKITASEYIDGLGAGISGTVVFALGTLLSSLGWVTGGFGDDDEDKFKQLNGEQEYALQLFGKSYTIDWAAPACIPFFIGVETVNALREDDDDFKLSDITDAMWNSLEPVINLSMLSGVQSMIESVKYAAEDKSVISLAGNIAKSYFSQGLPTVLGKTARTLDSKRRSNYIDKNSQLSEFSQSAINTAKSKIPGLEATRPEYINAWGQAESNGNIAERIFGNFVSPGYYSDIEYSEMSKELLRLSKEVKSEDVNVLPKTAQKSFEVNGETKYLTAEEYTKYAKAKGRYSYDYVSEFVNSSEYKKLTDEERAKVISNLYKYANAKAKTEVSDYDITKSFKTVSQWDKRGKSPVIYYIGRVLAEK